MSIRTVARGLQVPVAVVLLLLATTTPSEAVKRRAFVTSTTGTGNLASWPGSSGATALERGDSICRARAAAASLPNATTYRAWLSTSATDAYCHVQGLSGKKATGCGGSPLPGGGPWYLRNGISNFTGSLDRLTGPEGEIYRPVIFDESGTEPLGDRSIWTGTLPDGTAADTCSNWTEGTSGGIGRYGFSNASAIQWTSFQATSCATPRRLLCLEPGASEPFIPFWSAGAIAFVSSASGTGNLGSWPQAGGQQGLAAGDAVCRTLARQSGLPGAETFVAWLSTAAVDAAERVTVDAAFRRLDGFTVANSKADLLDGNASNSLHVDENGAYIGFPIAVWTGTTAAGTWTGSDCAVWTNGSVGTTSGSGLASMARGPQWTASATSPCTVVARLYCIQNQITQQLPLFADGFEIGSMARWSAAVP